MDQILKDLLCIQVWIHNRDGDSKEDIKTMADEEKEMQIEAGDRTAQLLFPYIKDKAAPVERIGAFGSTGNCVFWHIVDNDQRSKLSVK